MAARAESRGLSASSATKAALGVVCVARARDRSLYKSYPMKKCSVSLPCLPVFAEPAAGWHEDNIPGAFDLLGDSAKIVAPRRPLSPKAGLEMVHRDPKLSRGGALIRPAPKKKKKGLPCAGIRAGEPRKQAPHLRQRV